MTAFDKNNSGRKLWDSTRKVLALAYHTKRAEAKKCPINHPF